MPRWGPGLGDAVRYAARLREQAESALANLAEPLRLSLAAPLGSNPAGLRMLTYVPPGLPPGVPLVVVLHGCTQNAAAYDHGSGWSRLAERHGFALLFPEQVRGNNAQLCFNWFRPEDITRGRGEAESIRQMVEQMVRAHRLDGRRVYVTGLSAGGAMTAVMAATAPELFAGAAVIAGLPYGSALSVYEAVAAMRRPGRRAARAWGNLVRAASPGARGWPTMQIWQGDADRTVNPANAAALALQWSDVLGLPEQATDVEQVAGARHEVWRGADGRALLERWTLPGLGHGAPVGSSPGGEPVGTPGPYMLAAGVSSTWQLARSWGLLTQPDRAEGPTRERPARARPAGRRSTVARALRWVGLMR